MRCRRLYGGNQSASDDRRNTELGAEAGNALLHVTVARGEKGQRLADSPLLLVVAGRFLEIEE